VLIPLISIEGLPTKVAPISSAIFASDQVNITNQIISKIEGTSP